MLFERHHAATKFIKNLSHVEHGVVTIGHLIWLESGLNAIKTHHGQCHVMSSPKWNVILPQIEQVLRRVGVRMVALLRSFSRRQDFNGLLDALGVLGFFTAVAKQEFNNFGISLVGGPLLVSDIALEFTFNDHR
ncbi:unannotated protein [freshwater metagenome]|uniref:Unannotated protein n=1 Tax=freshwater metagenome TaxID=449393 RepID=A0A6J6DSZ6_9ZZZZ